MIPQDLLPYYDFDWISCHLFWYGGLCSFTNIKVATVDIMSTSYQKAHCISVFTHYTTSKTKGLTPFFFFCAVDFTSQKICLDGLPCSLTDYGCLGVFWHYVLFPHSMLIQATGYLFIDRATTSWYSEVQALEVEEPSPWIKWILIQPQAILQSSYMPSNRSFSSSFTVQPLETHHMFPRCLDNQLSWDFASEYNKCCIDSVVSDVSVIPNHTWK